MKERPILFSAPMVRALLDGSKTQTRRIVKNRKEPDIGCDMSLGEIALEQPAIQQRMCPYGQPGERLWVRETFQGPLVDDADAYRAEPADFQKPRYCEYAADGGEAPEFMTMDDDLVCCWRPSIHMPRWACRILLEVVSVRVERLNDCSEADAKAEGATHHEPVNHLSHGGWSHDGHYVHKTATESYKKLWDDISGTESWTANPWVWVIEFKRVAP